MKISLELRAEVVQRARFRCEYCLLHEDDAAFPHEVDHIISRQHGGETIADNLAYACLACNRYKGPNIASISTSGNLVPFFNPRLDQWNHRFRLNGASIKPIDVVGEVTARVLRLNMPERLIRRSILQRLQRYPKV